MREPPRHVPSLVAAALTIGLTALSPAFAADFPAGTYTTNGSLTLTLDGKGQFRVNDGKAMKVAGSYTVKADQLVLTDQKGPWACKGTEQSGTYSWKADGSGLTLAKVSDPCAARADSLTTSPWKRAR